MSSSKKKFDNDLLKPGMKLAFDENVSDAIMGRYARKGCLIVFVSPMGSTDEDWVAEAYAREADACISMDSDIGNIIDRNEYAGMQWFLP